MKSIILFSYGPFKETNAPPDEEDYHWLEVPYVGRILGIRQIVVDGDVSDALHQAGDHMRTGETVLNTIPIDWTPRRKTPELTTT